MTATKTRKPLHRSTSTTLLSLLLIVVLSACKRERPPATTTDSITPRQKTVLRIIGEGYPPLLAFEKIKDHYEKETGVRIEITKKDHMAVVAEMDREFSSGVVTYDLIVMPHRLVGKLVEKQHVRPLRAYLSNAALYDPRVFDPTKDLLPGWWREVGSYRGEPYGYPFMALTMYTWYRKDLFADPAERARFRQRFGRELEPPRTWEEYAAIAEHFHRPAQGLYGTGIQGQRHVALWYEWLQYAYAFGARVLDTPRGSDYGDIVVNSPAAVEATQFYTKMLKFSSPEAANHNWDDALSNFQQGKTAIAIMWHDSAPWVEDASESRVAGKVGYAPTPTATGKLATQLEGHALLIPRLAPHPEEAFRLMQWTLSHDAQVAQVLAGGMSPRMSTYDDARVKKISYMSAFRQIVGTSECVPKPTIPESDRIAEVMTLELSRIVTKEKTAAQGLGDIAVQTAKILEGKSKLRYPVQ